MKSFTLILAAVILLIVGITESNALAADTVVSQATDTVLSKYLVDISATQVSAGGLVGLTNSAITEIQSAQDLVLAVNPFSSGSSKNGFGIAITPARTDILPMSGKTYKDNDLMRLLGATTLSYAENTSSILGVSYREFAVSVDTTYYPDKDTDPIIIAAKAFPGCTERKDAEKALADFYNNNRGKEIDKVEEQRLMAAPDVAWSKCLKEANDKKKWNTTKLSLAMGYGWIRPDAAAGPNQSLGQTVTLGGIIKLTDNSAAYITYKNTSHEVDLTTLSGTPIFKDSSLTAIRITQGSENGGDLRWLAEYSDARASTVTVSNDVFMYAIGIDKKILPGAWLQFRVGRNRTADNTTTQTTSLLSLNWAPTATLFGSK